MGTLANSEDPDEMQLNAAFHQGLHCLVWLKWPSGTEIQSNLGYPNVNYPKLLGYSNTTDSPDFFLYHLLQ